MKKRGFTVPELIITLAVVGIAAAFAVPVMGNLMPDKYKLKAIACYNMINAATEEFLSNEAIYYAPDRQTNWNIDPDNPSNDRPMTPEELATRTPVQLSTPDGYPDCEALMCYGQPKVPPYMVENFPEDHNKYIALLRIKYGLTGNISDSIGEYSDGTVWRMDTNANGYSINVDIDQGGPNCTYNAENCERPDRFIINVNWEGNLTPGDAMLDSYLADPLNMNNKKLDYERARDFAADLQRNYN